MNSLSQDRHIYTDNVIFFFVDHSNNISVFIKDEDVGLRSGKISSLFFKYL